MARAAGVPLVEDPVALAEVKGWFEARGLPWSENNRRQALVPAGARLLPNRAGTAPGFWLPGPPDFIALPGPPRELEAVFQDHVRPELERRSGAVIVSRVLKVAGIGESALEPRLEDLFRGISPTVAPYAKPGEVHLRVTAKAATAAQAEAVVAPVVAEIRRRLGAYVYGEGEETLASAILARLGATGRRLAVAESATGGLVAARLTEVPGASDVFVGGAVVYRPEAKEILLEVPADLLREAGPVSGETAAALALRVRRRLRADIGLGTVAWAGPTGQDVGRAYIALAAEETLKVEERRFAGQRAEIRERLTQAALVLLWRHLAADPE